MSRSSERLLGDARARLRRFAITLRAALTSDADVTRDRRAADQAEASEIARTAGKLRGASAKVAQLRAYLEPSVSEGGLGFEARAELAQLWDQVPSDPPQTIRRVLQEDLGAAPEQLFAAWDDPPIAAASLGQVHAARLADGTEVVVKIQYPGIAAALREDLASPSMLRQLVGPGLGEAAEKQALEILRETLDRELDYVAERESLERFGRAFFGEQQILIPRPITDRCSARVLTMTRLPGESLSRFLETASEAERNEAGRLLFRFAFASPLRHGIVNGDPHPGNYLVARPGTLRLGFVDFGFVAELGELVEIDRRLFLSLVHRDGEALRYAAYEQGLVPDVAVFDKSSWRDFERAFGAPFLTRGVRPFGPAEAAELSRATSVLVRAGAVRLSPAAVVLWRQRLGVLTVLASLAPRLDLRRVLCEVLDDGHHPTPLYERYP